MSDLVEAMDTFFNRRPAPRTAELEKLRAENRVLREAVKRAHRKLAQPGHKCICAVCTARSGGTEHG